MIRCAWCGADNYAIDMWCSRCHHHLEWQPTRRRRGPILIGRLGALAAIAGVGLAFALPAAAMVNGSMLASHTLISRPTPLPAASARASASPAPSVRHATAEPAPMLEPSPTDEPVQQPPAIDAAPVLAAPPAVALAPLMAAPVNATGPAAAINRFYQAVSAHQFGAAANLWSPAMQAEYPPAIYIDQRFAGTQQIAARSERMLSQTGGTAVIYVDVAELAAGETHDWVGTWQLIDSPSGWLLNSPDLRAG